MNRTTSYRMRGDPDKIMLLMGKKGMSRTNVMKKSGLGNGTIHRVMCGIPVMPKTLGNFAFALGVDVTEIMAEGDTSA